MSGISIAWLTACLAISQQLGEKPLAAGIREATIGDWLLRINNSAEQQDELEPFEVELKHQRYCAMGLLSPSAGLMGGISEDQFLADMKAFGIILIMEEAAEP